jgi:hypothetical protein
VEELLRQCIETVRRNYEGRHDWVEERETHSVAGSVVVEQGRERIFALESTIDVVDCTYRIHCGAEEWVDGLVAQSQLEQARCCSVGDGTEGPAQEMAELRRKRLWAP